MPDTSIIHRNEAAFLGFSGSDYSSNGVYTIRAQVFLVPEYAECVTHATSYSTFRVNPTYSELNLHLNDSYEFNTKIHHYFDRIGTLKDGWLDEEDGTAFDPVALAMLRDHFISRYDKTLPVPFIYPDPEGEIIFEWKFPNIGISMEVEPSTLLGEYSELVFQGKQSTRVQLNLAMPADWEQLNRFIRNANPTQ